MSRFLYWSGHRWLAMSARYYLGYIFIAACIHKIAHPDMFAMDVATYDFLPLGLINIMAISLPWIELFAGVMLISGYKSRAASMMVAGMMIMFLIALGHALSSGIDMSCGCFASSAASAEDAISYKTVLRDVAWLIIALYVVFFDHTPVGLDQLFNRKAPSDA